MCGIVGIVGVLSAAAGRERVGRMNRAIVHRGPDDEGIWAGDGIAFGMRRLSIIDLSGGHQPIWTDDGVGIVFNGEIYNYRKLRDELTASGYCFRTHSDTEVILNLYHRDGLAAIARLEGMFAICLYDSRSNRIYLIRDRLGVKPLYYGSQGGNFFFGSEIKAILEGMGERPPVSREALFHYLTLRFVPSRQSIWEGIHKLPPGHILTLDLAGDTHRVESYWQVRFHSEAEDPARDYSAEFEELFLGAVEKRLLAADVPVGVLLSGGLDSSAVAAAAVELGHRDFHTFSIAFDEGGEFDETVYARQTARYVGANHHEIHIGRDEFMNYLPEFVRQTDEPLADLAGIPLYYVSRFAREHVKVVLSGEGADEVLAGYTLDRVARILAWMKRLDAVTPRLVRRIAGEVLGARRGGAMLRAWSHGDWRSCLAAQPYHATLHWTDAEKRKLMKTGSGEDSFGPTEDLIRHWYSEAVPGGHPMDALQQVYCREWLVEDLLMKADKMSMAASLELRVPFLDHALVEWSAKLPLAWKVGGDGGYQSKRILRQFALKRLPAEIVARPKRGFPVPAYRWLAGPLKDWAADFLGPRCRLSDYLDLAHLTPVLRAAHQGDVAAAHKVWLLIVAEQWLREWQ
ncbi:MAG: asparagine synthase (glutamine-hydrolyzing) [Pseudomonadota bacterium]|nr:asparagine synthase (glutamine-hydrolyzing) [Pseudomonadota bacterium]